MENNSLGKNSECFSLDYVPIPVPISFKQRSHVMCVSASISMWMEGQGRGSFQKELPGCMEKTTDDS